MNEQEWLASDDPAAMLNFVADPSPSAPKVSDRKLRLFACALWRSRWDRLDLDCRESIRRVEDDVWDGTDYGWQVTCPDYRLLPTIRDASRGVHSSKANYGESGMLYSEQTALLREVVGNPFRPAISACRCRRCVRPGEQHTNGPCRKQPPPWLTPQVLSLAQAAYSERPGRECGRCKGRGELSCPKCSGEGCSPHGMATNGPCTAGDPCPDCCQTGRVEDGTLDTVRLAVLADALEEAGCERRKCLSCAVAVARGGPNPDCLLCGCVESDIIAHLRSPGPHVRGCWVLDLIRGVD